nr:NAD(P)H-dependent oxidoreductase [uncultured Roseococcus sp.]
MKLLHIDSSILGENSVSRSISTAAVERLRQATPGLEVVTRDLAAAPLPHLLPAALGLGGTPDADSQAALQEFLDADIVVIGAPMYNFTIPTQLKAWLDRILVAGKTFRYTEKGPEGLAGGKRVIVAVSRGGFYGAGTPAAAAEHAETYLRLVLGFVGIADPEFIVAEGIALGAEQRAEALRGGLEAAGLLRAA